MAVSKASTSLSLKDILLIPNLKLFIPNGTSPYGQAMEWSKKNNEKLDGILSSYTNLDELILQMTAKPIEPLAVINTKEYFGVILEKLSNMM